jgi:flagellar hook-associated protein 1 FlgK
MSSFSGISTALSALHSQRRGLDVTGQNIANANTAGYSRQRVDMQAVGGTTVPAIHSVWTGAGAGVGVTDVARIRDAFLEARGRAEHAQGTYLTARQQVFTQLEDIFTEPSDTALQAQLADFWNGWADVSNRPDDLAARNQLLQRGAVVADGLRNASDAMSGQWRTIRTQVDGYAADINEAAAAVADLNQAIQRATSAGLPVNELSDQRDTHIMRLAELTGANAIPRENGSVDVLVAGSSLVTGTLARRVEVGGGTRLDDVMADPTGMAVGLRWSDGSGPAVVNGGTIAGALESLNTVLPKYMGKIDGVAKSLADTVNAAHTGGFDLDGNAGTAFYSGTTAATIGLALTDARQVAASGVAGSLDGSNADKLAELTAAEDTYRALVAGLGVESQTAGRRADIQTRISRDVDGQRESVAGVNLDEEMTNMLSYQRAYEAASRMLNAVDEALDTLINRTGLVGR